MREIFIYRSPMFNVYWFRVYYGRTAHVKVQFARTLADAYAQERAHSIESPQAANRRYPGSRQPVAARIAALAAPSREQLERTDPGFSDYLDEAARILDT
jgi:hypothetical protein